MEIRGVHALLGRTAYGADGDRLGTITGAYLDSAAGGRAGSRSSAAGCSARRRAASCRWTASSASRTVCASPWTPTP